MARLLDELVEAALLEIENASQWPPDATYYFDREAESDPVARVGPAQKLLRRVVVSLRFARFQALQVVRQRRQGGQTVLHHSPQLQALVPKGQRDDDELLAPVGQHTLLEGRPLQPSHHLGGAGFARYPDSPATSAYSLGGLAVDWCADIRYANAGHDV